MKLYYLPGACSLASHIALIWSGADYELERLSHETEHATEFMALNPKGAVPTITIDTARRSSVRADRVSRGAALHRGKASGGPSRRGRRRICWSRPE